MKKLLLIIATSLLLLTGCKDAYSTVKTPNEALVTIGKESITKGDVYSTLLVNYGSFTIVSDLNTKILDAEVEITDAMKEDAQAQLETYKSMYKDQWTDFMKYYGYTKEEDLTDSIINGSRQKELINKYVNENWDALVARFNPKKAVILSFADVDSANAAQAELEKNVDPKEVATAYNSSSTGESEIILSESTYPSEVMGYINTATASDKFANIPSTDGATIYLIKVVETDASKIKDQTVETIASLDTVNQDAISFYLSKYDFRIYDKSLYDNMLANYSYYVVQK